MLKPPPPFVVAQRYPLTVLPNFLVIGANKAGTTSLHHYLGSHPQVFISVVKEPSYFALAGTRPSRSRPDGVLTDGMVATREGYEALFEAAQGEKAVGEVSTAYLPSERAAFRIRAEIPAAKLIAILRDPADRARSAHAMHVSRKIEPLGSLDSAIEQELGGCSWRKYLKLGFYYDGLARYYELFGRDQVKVFLYDDFRDEPLRMLGDTFEWLGVDPTFTPDLSRRYNTSKLPVDPAFTHVVEPNSRAKAALKRMLPKPARRWMKKRARTWNHAQSPPRLSPETRRHLIEVFEADIRRVEALINRDLTGWRTI